MCGIAGIIELSGEPVNVRALKGMAGAMRHRGPDDEGFLLVDTRSGQYEERCGHDSAVDGGKDITETVDFMPNLGLGQRRLAIIDLSVKGHQPMGNDDGSVWITYNGEVYNYLELREELEVIGYTFYSSTDTEVILNSYLEWGEVCLEKFNGMWSFAIWDGRKKKLFCSRDRLGVKPFYYFFNNRTFIFSSEIKGILESGLIKPEADNRIICSYLIHGRQDHSDATFFKGVRQLGAACYLILDLKSLSDKSKPCITRYWSIDLNNKLNGLPEKEYSERFYRLLLDSVNMRLRSDVPVGTCLSGGLDSSSIVSLAARLLEESSGKHELQTFSLCFEDPRFDERPFIQEVLISTGAKENLVFPDVNSLHDELKVVTWCQDEPFCSTSVYAQWHVMKQAQKAGVKVLLDGQGSDELVAGYHGFLAAGLPICSGN